MTAMKHSRAKALTVAELIKLLDQRDPDAKVLCDGCDCVGAAGEVTEFNGDVLIGRVENMGVTQPGSINHQLGNDEQRPRTE